MVGGKRVVPKLLAFVARTGSRELFTLSLLATALGIAYGSAALFGVSFALGAFFAGVVLSESDLSHQAAADSLPLRDAFAVLFFVSVGMLFDPAVLVREPLRVAAVLLVIVVVKSLAAVAVVLLARQPLASALRVAAGLAQIGEFSFILADLGMGLGVLPPEGNDLILAGALLSITANPVAFDLAGRLARHLEGRPGVAAMPARAERPAGDRHVPERVPAQQGHAVIVGHGRVGSTIARVLGELELPFVVVELDRRRAEELRGRGLAAVWGDASAPGVLEAAGIGRARLLVVAVPDGFQARRVLDRAREVSPGTDVVVRTHSEGELARMRERGVGLALMAERELALGMVEYALRALGLREAEAALLVRTLRGTTGGKAEEEDELRRHAPELRPHRPESGNAPGERPRPVAEVPK